MMSDDDIRKNDMTSETSELEGAKDGFDLIEYPCEFAFKAMCRADTAPAEQHISQLVLTVVEAQALLSLTTNQSRTGKFESVTATVTVQNREQLESIYGVIAESSRVVMTL